MKLRLPKGLGEQVVGLDATMKLHAQWTGARKPRDRPPNREAYPDAVAESELVTIGAIEFRVLTLPALIAAKRAAGRPRDIEHLIELEGLLAMRRANTRGKKD